MQTQQLYETAISSVGLTGEQTVFDAYCGIGTIGIIVSSAAKRVIVADSNAAAISDEQENVRLNGNENIEFYPCDAGEFMEQFVRTGEKSDVLFMDPPRAGEQQEVLCQRYCAYAGKNRVYLL